MGQEEHTRREDSLGRGEEGEREREVRGGKNVSTRGSSQTLPAESGGD